MRRPGSRWSGWGAPGFCGQLRRLRRCAVWGARGAAKFPFLDGKFLASFCFVSVALATALGLRQTAVESRGGTWLFLLHRPASLWQVLAVKLVVGGGLYLICGLIPILSYAAWAAMPGKHASPFFWWMTADAWKAWGLITIVYLAAFLAGIRPHAGSARGSCPWRRAGFSPSC